MHFGDNPNDPPVSAKAEAEAEAAMAQAREDREVIRLLAETFGPEPKQEGVEA